jgi:hypothetical protein
MKGREKKDEAFYLPALSFSVRISRFSLSFSPSLSLNEASTSMHVVRFLSCYLSLLALSPRCLNTSNEFTLGGYL